ncbi:MAG: glycosyltransferase [Kiritimatiellae bacterium]|nr:glycosyltransferase [Kiritimatiellia bacterium]MDD5521091.1 glycosyltransferase [Kiritimatiellia bacterium]
MTAIHQLVAGFANGDAISNEAVVMRKIFRSWGFPSDIFCERKRVLPELRSETRDLNECFSAFKPEDIALLHLSIGSDVNDLFLKLVSRKAILYHNVTPSHYFDLINRQTAFTLDKGRRQVAAMSNAAQINIADSKFNAAELTKLGYKNVQVLPLILDLQKLNDRPDGKTLRAYDGATKNILFVGRCAPNKKIEDIIKAFYYFHKFVEPDSRLIQVGSYAGTERYHNLLLTQIRDLELSDVRFTSSIPQSQLNAFYKCAHLFLSMSEHEGFCIPIIESMIHDVPVLAYSAAAVPETMDGAGVLFHKKQYEDIAEMMGQIINNSSLREAIISRQRERLARYAKRDLASEFRLMLDPLFHS